MDRGIAAVTVMFDVSSSSIAGYYTLSASALQSVELPVDITRRLPGYPHLPAMLIGRLAVDRRYQGQRLGELLLINALESARALTDRVGAIAVAVDAKDERARSFYERMGFERLESNPFRLIISMKAIARL
ncbi:MAG: GNAT family N-acetyltransferase [Thermomicrobiales bacterium]|nr:GNAT family N-acetyltransferase [Thermomicrobiales bacterium]